MKIGLRRAALVAGLIFLNGCALRPVIEFREPTVSTELDHTPFFAQTEFHCGPAALAMMLGAEGIPVLPDTLAPLVYTPDRKGSFKAEMIAAARRYQRLPLQLAPQPEALFAALAEGKPVLVLQNLGLQRWPQWHYAVLIGYDRDRDSFLLRSGTEARQVMSATRFLASWTRAERWALILSDAGAVPEVASTAAWLAAAAPFESLGQIGVAQRAYEAAVARWPDSALSWLALANTRYAGKDLHGAEQALRRSLEIDPAAAAARHNLAFVLLQRGCRSAAERELLAVGSLPTAMQAEFARTLASIKASTAADAPDCP